MFRQCFLQGNHIIRTFVSEHVNNQIRMISIENLTDKKGAR